MTEVQRKVVNHHRHRRNFRWGESCHLHLGFGWRAESKRLNKRLVRPCHNCETLLPSRKEVSTVLVDVEEYMSTIQTEGKYSP